MNTEEQQLAKSRLASAYSTLGWTGLWIQILVGSLPIILMVYFFAFTRSTVGPRIGLRFVEYLALANLLVLVFTTFWFFRYTRLSKRIADPAIALHETSAVRSVWIGIGASVVGISFSMLVMFIEVAHLLFYFLSAPQGGVPVIQTTGSESASWVSAADMVSLMSLILTLFVEQLVLAFGLWLLLRTTRYEARYQS